MFSNKNCSYHNTISQSLDINRQTVLECLRSANPGKAKPWLNRRCSPGGAVTVNRGTLRCTPAEWGPSCSCCPTCRCRNERRRLLWTAGGASMEPAILLLLARGGGVRITSSAAIASDLSDSVTLCSVSEDVGDSKTISSEGVVEGGRDTFLGLCMFAMRQRMCTYSLLSPLAVASGSCGCRDMFPLLA